MPGLRYEREENRKLKIKNKKWELQNLTVSERPFSVQDGEEKIDNGKQKMVSLTASEIHVTIYAEKEK